MSRKTPSSDGFSREESRYLDGELPDETARRMENRLAADPDATDRVEAYRDAMDLWRDDVQRTAQRVDPEALADRIVAAARSGPSQLPIAQSRAAPWYAAAALLLIGIGITGTMLNLPAPAPRPSQAASNLRVLGDFEGEFQDAMVNLLIDDPELAPPLATGGPK